MLARGLRQVSRAPCSAQLLLRCTASTSAEQLSAIKSLREQSGAPMADVRAALMQADWKPGGACMHANFGVFSRSICCKRTVQPCSSLFTEDALQELRKKGLAASSKKVRRPLMPFAGCDVCSVARGNAMMILSPRQLWLHCRPPGTLHRASWASPQKAMRRCWWRCAMQ